MTLFYFQPFRSLKLAAVLMVLEMPLLISCDSNTNEVSSITTTFPAPAYPLITVDPYMSGWSESDQLLDKAVKHWTGKTRIVWTATLAEDSLSFQKLIYPVHKYVIETPSRVPNSDRYETTNAKMVGFQARSVVGGCFIKMLKIRQLGN